MRVLASIHGKIVPMTRTIFPFGGNCVKGTVHVLSCLCSVGGKPLCRSTGGLLHKLFKVGTGPVVLDMVHAARIAVVVNGVWNLTGLHVKVPVIQLDRAIERVHVPDLLTQSRPREGTPQGKGGYVKARMAVSAVL